MSLFTFLVCAFGGWICICRGTKMDSSTKILIQLQYALWFSMLAASGLCAMGDFLSDRETSALTLFMSGGIVGHLLLGVPAWRYGQPWYARKDGVVA